jgi:hypothetical protein
MQVNLRRHVRRRTRDAYMLCWQDEQGQTQSLTVNSVDVSSSGVGLHTVSEVAPGSVVYIEGGQPRIEGYCTVQYCRALDHGFRLGLQFHDDMKAPLVSSASAEINYYEFLQISPKAESATINRIYKFMAARLHPDNPESGDPERFLLLNRAYEVLSHPDRRAEYDASRAPEIQANPIFGMSDFLNGIEGENNRRLGVLSLLYNRRRTNAEHPGLSIFEIEKQMGFPREYLDFTTWYLRAKQYVTMGDNGELTLTAAGVDYVEGNAAQIPLLRKLLMSGPKTTTGPDSPRTKTGAPLELTAGLKETSLRVDSNTTDQ